MVHLEQLEEDLRITKQNTKVAENGKTKEDMARISFTSFLSKKSNEGEEAGVSKDPLSPGKPQQQSPGINSLKSPIKEASQRIVEKSSDRSSNLLIEEISNRTEKEQDKRKNLRQEHVEKRENQKKDNLQDVNHKEQYDRTIQGGVSIYNDESEKNDSPSKKRIRDDYDDRQGVKKERRDDDKYVRKGGIDYKKDDRRNDDYHKPYEQEYKKDADVRYDDSSKDCADENPRSGSDRRDLERSRPQDRDDKRRELSSRREMSASRDSKQNSRSRTSVRESPGNKKEFPVEPSKENIIALKKKSNGPDLSGSKIISPSTTASITSTIKTPAKIDSKGKQPSAMGEAAKRYKAMGDKAGAKNDKKKQYIFYAASILAFFSLPASSVSGHGLPYDPKYHAKFEDLKQFKNNVKEGLRRYEIRELLAVM